MFIIKGFSSPKDTPNKRFLLKDSNIREEVDEVILGDDEFCFII